MDQIKDLCQKISDECDKLATVNSFKDLSYEERFALIQPIIQSYLFVRDNAPDSFDLVTAEADIRMLAERNPAMKQVVEVMLEEKKEKKQSPNTNSIEPHALVNTIDSFINEYAKMRKGMYDTEVAGDIAFYLQECQNVLNENKSSFSPEVYSQLSKEIQTTISSINHRTQALEKTSTSEFQRGGFIKISVLVILSTFICVGILFLGILFE